MKMPITLTEIDDVERSRWTPPSLGEMSARGQAAMEGTDRGDAGLDETGAMRLPNRLQPTAALIRQFARRLERFGNCAAFLRWASVSNPAKGWLKRVGRSLEGPRRDLADAKYDSRVGR